MTNLVFKDRDSYALSPINIDHAGFKDLSEDCGEFLEDSQATGFQQLGRNIAYPVCFYRRWTYLRLFIFKGRCRLVLIRGSVRRSVIKCRSSWSVVERLMVPQITQQIVITPVNLPGIRHSPILLSTVSAWRVSPCTKLILKNIRLILTDLHYCSAVVAMWSNQLLGQPAFF